MFIRSFFKLACQKDYWSSPIKLARIVWTVASNLPRQMEICRVLSLPAFQAQVLADPLHAYKHLSRDYLFTGLPARHRAASFAHHLRFLRTHVPEALLLREEPLELTVFERREGDRVYSVKLDLPPQISSFEGDLRLGLLVDGVLVYCLQFTIVPGLAVQSKESDVVFILRVQGIKGHYEQIRLATKSLQEVAPPALLIAALQGIASAWGIHEMAGISATSQHAYDETVASLFTQIYDDFFLELGATRTTKDFFSSPLPLPAKPLDLIRNGHRSRTLRKRSFKLRISDEVREWMIENASPSEAKAPERLREPDEGERSIAS